MAVIKLSSAMAWAAVPVVALDAALGKAAVRATAALA
jgi:hypothetical protein